MPSCSIHRTLNLPLKAWWLACMVFTYISVHTRKSACECVFPCFLHATHVCDVHRWCEEIRGARTHTCAHALARTRTFRPSLFLPIRFSPRLREVRNTWSYPRTVSYTFLKSECLPHITLPLTLTLTLDWLKPCLSLTHTHSLSFLDSPWEEIGKK